MPSSTAPWIPSMVKPPSRCCAGATTCFWKSPSPLMRDEMWELQRVVGETGRRVMICHVLRYAPFYVAVKERLLAGRSAISSTSGHRARQLSSPGGVLYLPRQMGQRGKVRRAHAAGQMLPRHGSHHVAEKRRRAPGRLPASAATFSSTQPRSPQARGKRCLVDCGIEENCLYSAKSITSTIRTAGAFMCGTAWSIWKSPPLRTRSSR